jgi:hypothetical protein
MLSTARAIYIATKDDAAAVAAIRTEHSELALSIATGDGASDVTSATVNGQSFSAQVTMTKTDRVRLLGLIVKMYDEGAAISSRSRARFGGGAL